MGTWGTGLYSNDLAEDLKTTIKVVLKLPLEPDRLVEILQDFHSDIADDPQNEDHTAFWLVLADQFHKNGIDLPDLFARAREIIDSSADLKMAASLGMSASELKIRSKALAKLKTLLASPVLRKTRKTLKGPEPFLMNVGDLFCYPLSSSNEPVNPYMSAEMISANWKHDKWGALLVIECGRAFDYLAWYRPVKLMEGWPLSRKPDIGSLRKAKNWTISFPGTCPQSHFRKMHLEFLGNLAISQTTAHRLVKDQPAGNEYAIANVSISNSLDMGRHYDLPTVPDIGSLID